MVKLYDVFIGTVTSIRVEKYVTCKMYGVYISKWSGSSQTNGGGGYMGRRKSYGSEMDHQLKSEEWLLMKKIKIQI